MEKEIMVLRLGVKYEDYDAKIIPAEFDSIENLIGGYAIEATPAELRAHKIEMYCDEAGLLKGLEPNKNLFPFFFVGTVVFCGKGLRTLTHEQYEYLVNWFSLLGE